MFSTLDLEWENSFAHANKTTQAFQPRNGSCVKMTSFDVLVAA